MKAWQLTPEQFDAANLTIRLNTQSLQFHQLSPEMQTKLLHDQEIRDCVAAAVREYDDFIVAEVERLKGENKEKEALVLLMDKWASAAKGTLLLAHQFVVRNAVKTGLQVPESIRSRYIGARHG